MALSSSHALSYERNIYMSYPFLKNANIKHSLIGITLGICINTLTFSSYATPIFIYNFGVQGTDPGQFSGYLPGIGVSPLTNNIYISDFYNNRVGQFDQNGAFVNQFGVAGYGPEEFTKLSGVSVDHTGKICVTDGIGGIQIINPDNSFNNSFASQGENTEGFSTSPIKTILQPSTGKYYGVDQLFGVFIYNADGSPDGNIENTDSSFFASNLQADDLSMDPNTNILYVGANYPSRIARFDAYNNVLPSYPISSTDVNSQVTGISEDPYTKNIYVLNTMSNYLASEIEVYDMNGNLLSETLVTVPAISNTFLLTAMAINPNNGKIHGSAVYSDFSSDGFSTIHFDPPLWTQVGTSTLQMLPLDQNLNLKPGQNLIVSQYYSGDTGLTTLTGAAAQLTINPGSSFSTTALTLAGGKLTDYANTILTGPTLVTSNSIINSGTNNAITFTGGFSGAANLTKQGGGSIVLTGDASGFTGATAIEEGSVVFANNGPNMTYQSTISGAGSITQSGSNTLTLSGTNSYAGGTYLSNGTTSISNANNIGTGPIIFNNGATLQNTALMTLNNPITLQGLGIFTNAASNNLTVTSKIVGPGLLQKNGMGTIILTANNEEHTGGTDINGGTLVLNGSGTLGPGPLMFSGGTLINNTAAKVSAPIGLSGTNYFVNPIAGNSMSIDNMITGAGSLTLQGLGSVMLSNTNNNFSGGLKVTNTKVAFNAGSSLGSGTVTLDGGTMLDQTGSLLAAPLFLTSNSGTIINNSEQTTHMSGPISGTGDLTLNGPGTFIFGAGNTYSGDTHIAQGKAIMTGVNSFGNGGTVHVSPQGALQGVGTIAGSLVNNGSFTPGNSPGTVRVLTNYNGMGKFNIAIQPSANPQAGIDNAEVIINGTGDFTQSLLYVNDARGVYTRSARYKFVSASPGLLTEPFPAFPQTLHAGPYLLSVEYDSDAYYLVVLGDQKVILPTDGTLQQNKVASTLNNMPAKSMNDDIGVMISDIYDLPSRSEIAAALDQISPMRNNYAGMVSLENTIMFNRLITKHLEKYRIGVDLPASAPMMASSFNAQKNTENKANNLFSHFFSQKKKPSTTQKASLQESINNTIHISNKEQKLHTWLSPYYYISHLKRNHENNYGFKAKNKGILGGMDYQIRPYLIVGGGLGYEKNSIDYIYGINNDDGGKNNRIDAAIASAYAMVYSDRSYMDITLQGGVDRYKLRRHIDYLALTESTVTSKHKGYKITPHIGMGHTIKTPHLDVTPFIGTDYALLFEKGYTETGGGAFDMNVKKKRSAWLQQELGVRLDKKIALDDEHDIGLQGEIRYLYKKPYNVQKVSTNFVLQDAPYVLRGKDIATHTFAPSFAVHFKGPHQDKNNSYISLGYDGEYSKSFTSHMGYASVRFGF